jgi:hypothetical protein
MPEIPPAAIMAAAIAIERELLSGRDYSMAQDSDEALARVALEAAAPILAEAVAQKILAHRETIAGPADIRAHEDGARRARAARAHYRTAAQIAALAFFTDEDKKRLAAEALARGEFIACDPGAGD